MRIIKKLKFIIPLFILAFVIGCFATSYSNVLAAGNPSSCAKDSYNVVVNYFNVNVEWAKGTSGKYDTLKFTTKNGNFRVYKIEAPGYNVRDLFNETPTKEANDLFYKFGNDDFELTSSTPKSLTLNADKIKRNDAGATIKFFLGLSKESAPCDAYEKDYKGTAGTVTLEFTLTIPNLDVEGPKLIENKNYNGACKILRGESYSDNITGVDKNRVFNDPGSIAYYNKIVGYCFEQQVTRNYSASALASLIKVAVDTNYLIRRQEQQESSAATSAWSINFDNVKQAANVAGHSYTKESGDFKKGGNKSDSSDFSMSCKYTSTNFAKDLENYIDGVYNIKANSQYYYATKTSDYKVTYTYNHNPTGYSGMNTTDKTKTVCKKTCEEAVEVDYGPPVASKAGLCFEYQVQVTSRVKCSAQIEAQPPEKPIVCNPIPICNSYSGYVHQGGPNDEYESCVNKCDGGKYTKKCSNKCYDSVYGKKNTSGISGIFSKKTYTVISPVTSYSSSFPYYSGFYYYNTDHEKITWKSTSKLFANTYARYYKDNEDDRTKSDHCGSIGCYQPEDGFKKNIIASGLCKDHCTYHGCGKNNYLNQKDIDRDHVINVKAYNEKIDECLGSATCSTKKATFTINVTYKRLKNAENGDVEYVTVDFPLSTTNNKQKLQSLGNSGDVESTKLKDNIILDYNGCYKTERSNDLEYYTKWSFPGTWINSKTGEISYEYHSTNSGWEKRPNKFCLPLNAKDVNQSYWKYYYNKSGKNLDDLCDKNLKECQAIQNEIRSTNTVSTPEWNINAKTTNFGYFGWTFNINCFYALNTFSPPDGGPGDPSDPSDPSAQYLIRPVDLEKLFPATDGSNSDREFGYNWSSFANQSVKNPDNPSMPISIKQKIESNGTNIYNDEKEVDYSFHITRAQIRSIKSSKGERQYGIFKGSTVNNNGVISYKSNLFRDNGTLKPGSNDIPGVTALGCNNLYNKACTSLNA